MSKQKLSSVKRTISLREDVFDTAYEMADKYFGGNFSAYLTYLICADKYDLSRSLKDPTEDDISKEDFGKSITNPKKNAEDLSFIDTMISLGD